MKFNIITIFPEMISQYANQSILKRGQQNNAISINPVNLRDFTTDKHRSVDDTPYGGGAGMLMKPEPIFKALTSLDAIPFRKANGLQKVKKIFSGKIHQKKKTILLSPRGKQFSQEMAQTWKDYAELTIICGRYEGIDYRVSEYMVDEEVSVGPYVLAGGELGALIIVEAVSRLIPGVLGNANSVVEETFSVSDEKSDSVHGEYPQYTKPADFNGWHVPDVLLSGDHQKIQNWRKEHLIEPPK